MTGQGPARRLLRSRDLRRSTLVELFFDLVFVFALTQLSQALIRHLTWGESVRVLLLTMAVWWAWSVTAWVTDLYESQRPGIQWLVIGVMFGVLLMASALPEAFDRRGLVFAGAYVTLQTGRTGVLLLALPGRGLRRGAARVLFWFGVASVAWLTGAFVHGTSRVLLWAVALAVDYGAAILRWPTPGLGRSSVSEWGLAAEHLSERYRQILIIALGDTVLTIGSTYSALRPQPGRTVALATAFATTVLLWRIYSYRAGARISTSFTSGAQRARPARERLDVPSLDSHLDLEAQPSRYALELGVVEGDMGLGARPRSCFPGIGLGPLHRPEDAAVRFEILSHEPVGAAAADRRVARLGRARGHGEARHDIGHTRRLHLAAAGLGRHPDDLVHVLGLPGDDRPHAAGAGLGALGLAGIAPGSPARGAAAVATVGWCHTAPAARRRRAASAVRWRCAAPLARTAGDGPGRACAVAVPFLSGRGADR